MTTSARERLGAAATVASRLHGAVAGVWRGDGRTIDLVVATVLAGGHLLLEDVPGVGKTTLAAGLAGALGGRFARVQGTADLLPADLTGSGVLVPGRAEIEFRAGPVFVNVLLADEVNRMPPRTQSALLEAMGEGRVTVDGVTHALPRPFLVVATQNPYDQHGTWPLPESQLDRFLARLSLGYPDREATVALLQRRGPAPEVRPVARLDDVSAAVAAVDEVVVAPVLESWLIDVVEQTRSDVRLRRGVSPRGLLAWHRAVRALALVRGRAYAVPEDALTLAVPVLGHRVVARGTTEGPDVIAALVRERVPPT